MNQADNRENPHRSTRIDIQIVGPDRSNQFRTIIPNGVELPHEFNGEFSFAFDGMHVVRILLRSESGLLPPVLLRDLPKGRRGTALDLTLVYERDHSLRVHLVHLPTGREVKHTFSLPS